MVFNEMYPFFDNLKKQPLELNLNTGIAQELHHLHEKWTSRSDVKPCTRLSHEVQTRSKAPESEVEHSTLQSSKLVFQCFTIVLFKQKFYQSIKKLLKVVLAEKSLTDCSITNQRILLL